MRTATLLLVAALEVSTAALGAPSDKAASEESARGMPGRVRRLDVTMQLAIVPELAAAGKCEHPVACEDGSHLGTITIHAVATGDDFVLSELSLTLDGESVAKTEIARFIGRPQAVLNYVTAVQSTGDKLGTQGERGDPYVAIRGLTVKSDRCDSEDASIVVMYDLRSRTSKASETCSDGASATDEIKVRR